MPFDSAKQREIMGRFATGVTVVSTTTSDGGTWGMTANAVTSLSLLPPLVLVAVVRGNETHAHLKASGVFAINILTSEHEELSNRFAGKGPRDFSNLETTTAVTGAPILSNSLGYVDCRLTEILPGGDHDIFVGEIVAGEVGEGTPLLFYAGKYGQIQE